MLEWIQSIKNLRTDNDLNRDYWFVRFFFQLYHISIKQNPQNELWFPLLQNKFTCSYCKGTKFSYYTECFESIDMFFSFCKQTFFRCLVILDKKLSLTFFFNEPSYKLLSMWENGKLVIFNAGFKKNYPGILWKSLSGIPKRCSTSFFALLIRYARALGVSTRLNNMWTRI